ncbi:translation initiation factor IF-2 [Oscillospiraceae bacterium OttesenSCG-928-G22]|nr:translation initiation factor IF-2 [Oscillospiraceae bacterium OttesenSCG-928-G22]
MQQKEKKSNENTRPTGTRQTHVVDTRGSTVDLSKYDDRVEKLVPEKAQNMGPRKEKIKSQNQRRSGPGGQSQKRRQEEQDRLRKLRIETLKKQVLKVSIPDEISVGELASRLKKTGTEVVRALVKMGTMASLSQIIDFDTASLVALEFGAKVEREVHVTIEERLIDDSVDKAEDLSPRSPVVVVMGHVDHGKTSLLDTIRKADVAAGEAGGITQHIGAYTVDLDGGQRLTFLDTPGHAAFTSMRERGANTTDIAILVVAADDGIMPQTIEAINHAKAAEIPIIVAVNKMDKPDANPDRVMQQLTEHALVPEDWGGETIVVKVSAKTGDGIPQLLEMVLLTAEMRELRANPNRRAMGTVIEAKLDRGRGPVATMLVQNGTLRQGDTLIAGKAVGRVRAMTDYLGNVLEEAGPSSPVEITGLSEVPEAGDQFHAVEDERMARELVEKRKFEEKAGASKTQSKVSLEDLFAQIKEGEIKDLNIIVKADVQGSVEALKTSLEKLSNEEVRVRVIHSGAGAVNESDVLLASTSNAIIVGFNVRPDGPTTESARRAGVDMRLYRVIYECIEEIEAAMKGLLAPKFKEEVLGHAEVRQIFKASNIGTIAGCYVQDGKIVRNAEVRVVRDGVVVYEGVLASLKRFKDDAKEVARGYECGISIENFNDIKEQDVIEAFHMVEIER